MQYTTKIKIPYN